MRATREAAFFFRSRCGLLFCAFLSSAVPAASQIRVLAPADLKHHFDSQGSQGRIVGATATFGAPFYGEKVFGRLVYGESIHGDLHCTKADYVLPETKKPLRRQGPEDVQLINIVVVLRGKCSFTKKVNVAYSKGAHAVIIVDKQDSQYNSSTISSVIVADDGFGGDIHIPSILVAKEDGVKLIRAVRQSPAVIVELAWSAPTDHVVTVDVWMSSASGRSMRFMNDFAESRRALNEVMNFRPHYHVFSLPAQEARHSGLCFDDDGLFCAEDPDGVGGVTGKDVLEEDVRQLCIHENTAKPYTSVFTERAGKAVHYAEEYWAYIEQFLESCPVDGKTPEKRFGRVCSEKLMKNVGLNTDVIDSCMIDSARDKLKRERDEPAWSPSAVRVNGWRYDGMLEADLVTRAICSGFIQRPEECKKLLSPRDPTKIYTGDRGDGVSLGTFFAVFLAALCIAMGAGFLYKRNLKQSMRTTLREEVMLEVESQMSQYKQLRS
jgi:hypothetical protein